MIENTGMARVPGRQLFTKAPHMESALKRELAGAAKRSQSTTRQPERIIEERNRQSAPEFEAKTYEEGRCRVFNPNAYAAPFERVRTPRSARNRCPAGWVAVHVTLPKMTVEGLKQVAIALAQDQQHSPWPKVRRRYARTKSHLVGEALDDFFRKVGFPEFCIEGRQ